MLLRSKALGKFTDLLTAVTSSEAMLLHLNAASSTSSALNENLGRELLELHTVGVGNFAESEVVSSARILTGWLLDPSSRAIVYSASDHYVGAISMPTLGFSDANSAADGRATFTRYMSFLARHQQTANALATKLIQYFCTDEPTSSHVSAVASAYLKNDTDIRATMMALITHSDFAVVGKKASRPLDDLLQIWRLRGHTPNPPTYSYNSAGTAPDYSTWGPLNFNALSASFGQPAMRWSAPDGYPTVSTPWLTPGNFLNQWGWRVSIIADPQNGFSTPDLATQCGIPKKSLTVAQVCDYVAQYVWGQPADDSYRAAMAAIFDSTTFSPDAGSWSLLYFFLVMAVNHPLMSVR